MSSYAYKSAATRAAAEAATPLAGGAAGAAGAKAGGGGIAALLFSKAGIAAALVTVAVITTAAVLSAPSKAADGASAATTLTAVARLANGTISGSVTFSQLSTGGPVSIVVAVTADPAELRDNAHGFHIHNNSALGGSTTCLDTGPHMNPFSQAHGGPNSAIRHVGDLGNVMSSGGVIATNFTDATISLRPQDKNVYIVGRAILLHDWSDDFGAGASSGSTCGRSGTAACSSSTTGNAGARLACGVIVGSLSGASGSALRGA
jgi:Cu-Zn family superoxide dismutase